MLDLKKGWKHIERNMSKKRRNRLRRGHRFNYNVVDVSLNESNLLRFTVFTGK